MKIKINVSPLLALMYLILAALVLLSLYNLIYNRSFWIDEAMLANSIVNKGYLDLLSPLDYDQVAPIGYLFIQKTLTYLFGYSDWSFRLFSYFCFLYSLWIFYRLNYILFHSIKIAVLACILFCLNPMLFDYGIEAKPYMFECLISMMLLLVYLKAEQSNKWKWFTVSCFISIWFSNISIIIITAILIAHLYQAFRCRSLEQIQIKPLIATGISFLIYYWFFIYNHPAKFYMLEFWNAYGGFSPKDTSSSLFYLYHISRLKSISIMLVYKIPWVISMLLITIAVIKYFKNNILVLVALITLTLHFILAYFRLYPYSARTLLYLFPLFLSLLAAGTWTVISFIIAKTKVSIWGYLLLGPILLILFVLSKKIPFEKVEMKRALTHLNGKIDLQDKLYVFSASKPSFEFYRDNFKNLNHYKLLDQNLRSDCSSYNMINHSDNQSIWILYSLTFPRKLIPSNTVENFINSMQECSFVEVNRSSFKNVIIFELKKKRLSNL